MDLPVGRHADKSVGLQGPSSTGWGARWKVARDAGGVRLSSGGQILGRTDKPTSIGSPGGVDVGLLGKATMLGQGSKAEVQARLEEVCVPQ